MSRYIQDLQGSKGTDIYADGIACGLSCSRATFPKDFAVTEGGWSVLLNIFLRILLQLLVLGGAIITPAWSVKNRFTMLILKDVLHSGSGAALYCAQC